MKYKHTTTFPDEVSITVTVESLRGLKLKLAYTMTNRDGDVVCEAISEHCFLDQEGRFVSIKRKYPELWELLARLSQN